MTEPNTDIPYTSVDEFAVEKDDNTPDPDRNNVSILIGIDVYLKEAIEEHQTIDVIDLTEAAKMTPTEQIAVHKVVTEHLRNIKAEVSNKIEELKR